MSTLLSIVLFMLIFSTADGFLFRTQWKKSLPFLAKKETGPSETALWPATHAYTAPKELSKLAISSTLAIGLFFSSSLVAGAAEDKAEKKFELCLSKCVFDGTKPPPVGADASRLEARKTRVEIIRECKKKCATKDEQLLLGKPKQKAPAAEN